MWGKWKHTHEVGGRHLEGTVHRFLSMVDEISDVGDSWMVLLLRERRWKGKHVGLFHLIICFEKRTQKDLVIGLTHSDKFSPRQVFCI